MPNLIDRIRVRVAGRKGVDRPDRVAAIGQKSDPILSCNFSVTITDLGTDFNLPDDPQRDKVGFSRIDGIDTTIDTDEVSSGTNPVVDYLPRSIKYGVVTFERGVSRSATALALISWFNDIKSILAGTPSDATIQRSIPGAEVPAFIKRRDILIEVPIDHRAYSRSVVVKDRPRPVVGKTYKFMLNTGNVTESRGLDGQIATFKIRLVDAWPVKLEFSGLNANENNVWLQRMEMRHSGVMIDVT